MRDLGFRLKFKVALVLGKLAFNRIINLNLVPNLAKHETVMAKSPLLSCFSHAKNRNRKLLFLESGLLGSKRRLDLKLPVENGAQTLPLSELPTCVLKC